MTAGTSAIGRVAAVGPDAALLEPGQLVMVDCTVRGRDDPTAVFLSGIHEGYSLGSRKLMHGEWKDSTYAEFAKVPLETCEVLNETKLLGSPVKGGLGYRVEDLGYIPALMVPYGGLKDIDLKAGETVIISPATGAFGGAAVLVALAMGAKVIAMGRNKEKLEKLAAGNDRIEVVPISGDTQRDVEALKSFGAVDVFFDISPPEAEKSTHITSAILALRHGGRISLMGGIKGNIPIPHSRFMHWNLTMKGKWMYEREDIKGLLKLVETGMLKIGERGGVQLVGRFGLEEWEKAFTVAEENGVVGKFVVLAP